MCEKLDINRNAYYDWIDNANARFIRFKELKKIDKLVSNMFTDLKSVRGPKAVCAELLKRGKRLSYYSVRQSMLKQNLVPRIKMKKKKTTIPDGEFDIRLDLVKRNFKPPVAGTVLVGDITYLKYGNTHFYLATVIDLATRMVVGFCIGKRMTVDIVINALVMAKMSGLVALNAIFHSDRGSQYTSLALRRFCDLIEIRLSVGRTGSCHDNAVAESFFSIIKREVGEKYVSYEEGVAMLTEWIKYYNNKRPHSTLGYNSPVQEFLEYHCFSDGDLTKLTESAIMDM
jgi:transposase InsO family protein